MKTIEQIETKEEYFVEHSIAILSMAEAINALTQQLSDAKQQLQLANERIAQLESIVYGGSTKWSIVYDGSTK